MRGMGNVVRFDTDLVFLVGPTVASVGGAERLDFCVE